MRLVFCGTPGFAVPTLETLLRAGHRIELVISQPDRSAGRGLAVQYPAVKQVAIERGLRVLQPETIRNNQELQLELRAIAPDAIIVVAYGRIVPPWMLSLPKFGNLNLHASLLPKYRGAAPIQWAVANGEVETGVTTMRIDQGLDTGDLLLQERVAIAPDQTSAELSPILAELGARLMAETLARLDNGTATAQAQDDTLATNAPMLTREDGRVDWSRPAAGIYNRWRGFQPWPGAFTRFRGKNLTLNSIRSADCRVAEPPGTLLAKELRLFAASGGGTAIEILELQPEGKRRMSAGAFLNGYAPAVGEQLG